MMAIFRWTAMTTYSVAEAKNRLPRLIDEAIEGSPVVITRHGKPVAELRPVRKPDPERAKAADEWLHARRQARPAVPITSVELLRQIYEEE
jgi:prevent-host-death family protein